MASRFGVSSPAAAATGHRRRRDGRRGRSPTRRPVRRPARCATASTSCSVDRLRSSDHSSSPGEHGEPDRRVEHAVGGQLQRLVAERRCGDDPQLDDQPFGAARDGGRRRGRRRAHGHGHGCTFTRFGPPFDTVEGARGDRLDDHAGRERRRRRSSSYGTATTLDGAVGERHVECLGGAELDRGERRPLQGRAASSLIAALLTSAPASARRRRIVRTRTPAPVSTRRCG